MSLEIIHLKATESLFHILDEILPEKSRIKLIFEGAVKQLHIHTESRDIYFQMETEKHPNNFFLARMNDFSKSGEFIGLINQRLRTRANAESFKIARDNLIKDVERCRQQKLQVLTCQAEAASMLKSERTAKCKRILTRNKQQKHSAAKRTKAANVGKHPSLAECVTNVLSSPSRYADQSVHPVSQAAECDRIFDRPSFGSSTEGTFECSTPSQVLSYCACQCTKAIRQRRALEERLMAALNHTDATKKGKLVESIQKDLYALVDELRNDQKLIETIPISIS
ncbi:hypothetical protein D915_008375 [Fasciola hepatica]|uniref:Uncharacterized protein n=1 Tax=Fasciola hepatica TaxID=6192 RepID=A0A4E0RUF6_FASHE|nr:hypothetical protein D915_008375 [Fasciola hepatica]